MLSYVWRTKQKYNKVTGQNCMFIAYIYQIQFLLGCIFGGRCGVGHLDVHFLGILGRHGGLL